MATATVIPIEITGDAGDLVSAWRRSSRESQRATRGMQQDARRADSAFGGLKRQVAGVGAGLGTLVAAYATKELISGTIALEQSQVKLRTQLGLTAAEAEAVRRQSQELATTYGIAAQSSVDAGFAIQSAGLRGAAAQEALEAATKGAAIGLGEARDIGLLSAAAMTAYGSETLSATRSTEILAAGVKAGNLEASALASSLGQSLAPAAELDIAFEELTGSVAFYTRLGLSASEANTAVRQTMNQMLKPSRQAQGVLDDIGLSAADLRTMIGERGLVGTLKFLRAELGEDQEAFARIIGSAEALGFALAVTGKGGEAFDEIMRDMRNSSGSLDEAWQIQADTVGTQLAIAWEKAKVPLQELAADLLPLIAELIGEAAQAFLEFMEFLGIYEGSEVKWLEAWKDNLAEAGYNVDELKGKTIPLVVGINTLSDTIKENTDEFLANQRVRQVLADETLTEQERVEQLALAFLAMAIDTGEATTNVEAYRGAAMLTVSTLRDAADAADAAAEATAASGGAAVGAGDDLEGMGGKADTARAALAALRDEAAKEQAADPFADLNASLGRITTRAADAQAELIATGAAVQIAEVLASGADPMAMDVERIFYSAVEQIRRIDDLKGGTVQHWSDTITGVARNEPLGGNSGIGGGSGGGTSRPPPTTTPTADEVIDELGREWIDGAIDADDRLQREWGGDEVEDVGPPVEVVDPLRRAVEGVAWGKDAARLLDTLATITREGDETDAAWLNDLYDQARADGELTRAEIRDLLTLANPIVDAIAESDRKAAERQSEQGKLIQQAIRDGGVPLYNALVDAGIIEGNRLAPEVRDVGPTSPVFDFGGGRGVWIGHRFARLDQAGITEVGGDLLAQNTGSAGWQADVLRDIQLAMATLVKEQRRGNDAAEQTAVNTAGGRRSGVLS